MLPRLVALVLALLMTGAGVARSAEGVRCVATGQRMSTPRPCCHHADGATTTIDRVCCERIPATATPDLRANEHPDEHRLTASVLAGFVVLPPAGLLSQAGASERHVDLARGPSRGDRLHRHTSVSRI